uniref:Uncharacterized protein n=1 Tax=Ditylenchus dipsaci TaxID=166011 RepID=A0A915CQ94_9BILA
MINCATNQMRRVELLRESLEQSLKNCSKLNNSVSTYSSVMAGVEHQPKAPLCLIFQSPVAAVIQVSGSPKPKSPENSSGSPSHLHQMLFLSSPNKPLRVIVPTSNGCQSAAADSGFEECSSGNENSKDGSGGSVPMMVNGAACSPASSVDSGFASPAATSQLDLLGQPLLNATRSLNTATNTTANSSSSSTSKPPLTPILNWLRITSRRLFTNRRSKDQHQQLDDGSGRKVESSTNFQVPSADGLKSILKKPASGYQQHGGNHMRRNPTRFSLNRSASECADDDDMTVAFNGMVLNKLCGSGQEDSVVFEEDEEMGEEKHGQRGSESSLNTTDNVTTAGESSDEKQDNPPEKRKKRVSFSEHVQARIYRSNSSILGQKKKNEKKKLSKRRRSESENSNSESSCSELTPSVKSSKGSTTASNQAVEQQEHLLLKSDKEIGTLKSSARRDSGIIEDTTEGEDDVMCPATTRPVFSAQTIFPPSWITIQTGQAPRLRRLSHWRGGSARRDRGCLD